MRNVGISERRALLGPCAHWKTIGGKSEKVIFLGPLRRRRTEGKTGTSQGNARPHPGPLPQGEGDVVPASLKMLARGWRGRFEASECGMRNAEGSDAALRCAVRNSELGMRSFWSLWPATSDVVAYKWDSGRAVTRLQRCISGSGNWRLESHLYPQTGLSALRGRFCAVCAFLRLVSFGFRLAEQWRPGQSPKVGPAMGFSGRGAAARRFSAAVRRSSRLPVKASGVVVNGTCGWKPRSSRTVPSGR